MKVKVKHWHAIAQWQWDTGKPEEQGDAEEDVCGICRVPYEGCCPSCKVPGDDCPLMDWDECVEAAVSYGPKTLGHRGAEGCCERQLTRLGANPASHLDLALSLWISLALESVVSLYKI
ncbi:hypothetical protein EVG20_g7839 [Dentipellis fragilis]|uniref:Anaphase-promoting complex subunit 11 RING-H2 finger domain-containing protein n=1 Tax=Dentipellis fragilis TaxID=205917 RepID=A0A4Y9YC38_9AGAM|nr:hypothetical protein EVG20_g7839 [Dentipellis fragilis]